VETPMVKRCCGLSISLDTVHACFTDTHSLSVAVEFMLCVHRDGPASIELLYVHRDAPVSIDTLRVHRDDEESLSIDTLHVHLQ